MEYQNLINLKYVGQIYQHFWNKQMEAEQLKKLINDFTVVIFKVLSDNIQNDIKKYQIIKYNIIVWTTYHQKYSQSNEMIIHLLKEDIDVLLKIKLFLIMCRNYQNLNFNITPLMNEIEKNLETNKNLLSIKNLEDIQMDIRSLKSNN